MILNVVDKYKTALIILGCADINIEYIKLKLVPNELINSII